VINVVFYRQLRYDISAKITKADFLFEIGHAAQISLPLATKQNDETHLCRLVALVV
jgi:hypothetical protein